MINFLTNFYKFFLKKTKKYFFKERRHAMKTLWIILVTFLLISCGKTKKTEEVIIYTALDRNFSEPILKKFEQNSGIIVRCKYDTESTKTVGLTAALYEERNHPRCDVFWNNEILHTLRLQKQGILTTYCPSQQINIPKEFYDKQGYWTGFAARSRVIIVNTEKVKPENYPSSITDFTQPYWKGKFGIARPVAGTTATHIACLFAELGTDGVKKLLQQWKANDVRIESGNKSCAEKVGAGELYAALTDTDDAMIEILQKKPVTIIYPDSQPPQKLGTLFIPNTVALIANSPNPENGKKLIEFLLSPEVETILALGESAQIPLNKQVQVSALVKTPHQIQAMKVDFNKSVEYWEEAQKYIIEDFLK